MATSKKLTSVTTDDLGDDDTDTPVSVEPSEARQKFMAGEITWREYVEAENQ